GEGNANPCSGSRERLAVRHEIRETLSERQRQGDRDPVKRRAQVCEDGRDGSSSGTSCTKTWRSRSGSQRYLREVSSETSGVTTIESRSREMSPSASEMSRSTNTPGANPPPASPAKTATENQGVSSSESRRTKASTKSRMPSSLASPRTK